MIHKLGGIAVGMAVALVIMIGVEALGHSVFGAELGPDGAVPATSLVPFEVNASVLLSWFLAALVGGYVAVWISRTRWTAWAVAGLILLAVGFRFVLAPAPAWMIIGGIIAAPLAGWLAQQLPRRKAAA